MAEYVAHGCKYKKEDSSRQTAHCKRTNNMITSLKLVAHGCKYKKYKDFISFIDGSR